MTEILVARPKTASSYEFLLRIYHCTFAEGVVQGNYPIYNVPMSITITNLIPSPNVEDYFDISICMHDYSKVPLDSTIPPHNCMPIGDNYPPNIQLNVVYTNTNTVSKKKYDNAKCGGGSVDVKQ